MCVRVFKEWDEWAIVLQGSLHGTRRCTSVHVAEDRLFGCGNHLKTCALSLLPQLLSAIAYSSLPRRNSLRRLLFVHVFHFHLSHRWRGMKLVVQFLIDEVDGRGMVIVLADALAAISRVEHFLCRRAFWFEAVNWEIWDIAGILVQESYWNSSISRTRRYVVE